MSIFEIIKDSFTDAFADSLRILVFLVITYFLMELFERKAGSKAHQVISRASYAGPVWGSLLGVIPQCGFSAVAASLFSGRMLTIGTMFAVFLSTSDEMLPIFISAEVSPKIIFSILGTKVILGIFWGYVIELFFFKNRPKMNVPTEEELAERAACECCLPPIWFSALVHAVKVFFYIVLLSFLLNVIIGILGEATLANAFTRMSLFSEVIAGLIGLIPNCASSVVLTELYLEQLISPGAMIAGLLVNAGVGLLVLFEENRSVRENLTITGLLLLIGVVSGIAIDLIGIVF